jgi:hypothetical protein
MPRPVHDTQVWADLTQQLWQRQTPDMEDAKVAANMTPLLGDSPAIQVMPGLNQLTQGEEPLNRDDVWN